MSMVLYFQTAALLMAIGAMTVGTAYLLLVPLIITWILWSAPVTLFADFWTLYACVTLDWLLLTLLVLRFMRRHPRYAAWLIL